MKNRSHSVSFARLTALETKNANPLAKKQVEAARDKAVVMAMQRRDRERGYADLDPDLAWKQWQLVRDRE